MSIAFALSSRRGYIPLPPPPPPVPPHGSLVIMWYGSLHSVTPVPQFLDQPLLFYAVPGVVCDLTGQPKITSIVLTWSAPQEPNGVIISYEVTYRVSDGNLVTNSTTDLRFTIPSLTAGTNATEISVSAYTSVGRGDPVQIPHLGTLNAPREYTLIHKFMAYNYCNYIFCSKGDDYAGGGISYFLSSVLGQT